MKKKHPQLQGFCLIAHPAMAGSFFEHSIILITIHNAKEGAVGFIINRPTTRKLGDYLPSVPPPMDSCPVFKGGPVQATALSLVGIAYNEKAPSLNIISNVTPAEALNFLNDDPAHARLWSFMGYCGWSPRQLEQELEAQHWIAVPATPFLLSPHGKKKLWKDALKRYAPTLIED